jgi:Lysozyme like domain
MKNDQKFLIGVLAFVLGFTGFVGAANANALSVENNLSTKTIATSTTAKAVFLVSRPKGLVQVKKNLNVLAKYQNSARLTDKELKDLLSAVGFKGKHLVEAWAIAKKETHGNPLGFNGNAKTGDSSFGLFQINMLRDMGPERRAKFGLNYNADLLNPVLNAQVAYWMSRGGKDWSSWHGITSKTKIWMKKFPY